MPPPDHETPELNPLCAGDPLARHLAALQPMPAGLNRDRLLYDAGAEVVGRQVRFWRGLACGQGLAMIALVGVGVTWLGMPTDPVAAPMVVQRSSPAEKPVEAAPGPNLAEEVLPEPVAPESPSAPAALASAQPDPEDVEIARLLQLRADIFAVGLSVLPTQDAPRPRADATALERSLELPPGVLASPYQPKPRTPDLEERP